MKTLLHWTWGFFAADALLAIVLIVAAIFEDSDAAGRGLAHAYSVFIGIALLVLTAMVAITSYFQTRIGLAIVLAVEVLPWVFLLREAVLRIVSRLR